VGVASFAIKSKAASPVNRCAISNHWWGIGQFLREPGEALFICKVGDSGDNSLSRRRCYRTTCGRVGRNGSH
jgi:hypothetical protein